MPNQRQLFGIFTLATLLFASGLTWAQDAGGDEAGTDADTGDAGEPAGPTVVIPETVRYAGFLADGSGPVTDTLDLDVALYADVSGEDEPLWAESHVAVEVITGEFSLSLGSVEALPLEVLAGGPLYIAFTIGDETLAPRLPLESLPYASVTNHALSADNDDGIFVEDVQVIDAEGVYLGETLTLDGLGCESGQFPLFDGEAWTCEPLTTDNQVLALAGQMCDPVNFISGVDDSGLPVCEDYTDRVTNAFLAENGYVTMDALDDLELFSPANRPSFTDFQNIPGGLADGVDNDVSYTGLSPVEVNGTTVQLASCGNGQVLKWDGDGFECAAPPSLSCVTRNQGFSNGAVQVSCLSGEIITGGGFFMDGGGFFWTLAESRPNGSNWFCNNDNGSASESGTCYARCCRID